MRLWWRVGEEHQHGRKNLEQEMVGKVAKKRSELLQPIYDAFNKAVKEVGNERDLDIILDADKVLFAQEYLNVGAYVKAKLGI